MRQHPLEHWTPVGFVHVPTSDIRTIALGVCVGILRAVLAYIPFLAIGAHIDTYAYFVGCIAILRLVHEPVVFPYLRRYLNWPLLLVMLDALAWLSGVKWVLCALAIPARFGLVWYAHRHSRYEGHDKRKLGDVVFNPVAWVLTSAASLAYATLTIAVLTANAYTGPQWHVEHLGDWRMVLVGAVYIVADIVYRSGAKTPIAIPIPYFGIEVIAAEGFRVLCNPYQPEKLLLEGWDRDDSDNDD